MEEWIGGEFDYNEFNRKLKINRELERAKEELRLIKRDINNNDEKILENNNLISNYEKINKYYNRILKIAIAISPLIGAAVSIGIKAIAGVVASKFILSTTILIALFEGVSIVHNRCSLQDHKKRFKKEHFNNENITKEEMKEKIEKKNKELVKENT